MDDVRQMQQEAARRVSRMQEHSRRVLEAYRDRAAQADFYPAPRLYDRSDPSPPPPTELAATENPPVGMDGEQILLIGLALVLLRSGCRLELILALLYIAL